MFTFAFQVKRWGVKKRNEKRNRIQALYYRHQMRDLKRFEVEIFCSTWHVKMLKMRRRKQRGGRKWSIVVLYGGKCIITWCITCTHGYREVEKWVTDDKDIPDTFNKMRTCSRWIAHSHFCYFRIHKYHVLFDFPLEFILMTPWIVNFLPPYHPVMHNNDIEKERKDENSEQWGLLISKKSSFTEEGNFHHEWSYFEIRTSERNDEERERKEWTTRRVGRG